MPDPMKIPSDRQAAEQFARHWVDAWNRRDVETVLAHYADECTFVSPKAAAVTGEATMHNKTALRAYWTEALRRIDRLHFVLDHVLWDADTHTVGVVYTGELAGQRTRAVEVMRFGPDGRIDRGEALYGAAVK
jgi:ketosteroid isomerase-like protein